MLSDRARVTECIDRVIAKRTLRWNRFIALNIGIAIGTAMTGFAHYLASTAVDRTELCLQTNKKHNAKAR